MPDTNTVKEAMAALQAEVREALKGVETQAELKERQDKLDGRITEVMESLKATTTRTGEYTTDPKSPAGVKEIVGRGVRGLEDFKALSYFERAPGGRLRFDTSGPILNMDSHAREILDLHDDVYIAHEIALRHVKGYREEMIRSGEKATFMRRFPALGKRWDAFMEAFKATELVSTTSTAGDEWVPTGMAATLFDEIRTACPEAAIFPHVVMPTQPWDYPKKAGVGQAYIRSEGVAPTSSVLTTGKITFTAYTFANLQGFTDEMNEDSLIAVIPAVREDIVRSLAEAMSQAICNGDADGANHIDDDYATGVLGAKFPQNAAFNGLRQYALDANSFSATGGGNALSYADIGSALTTMGKYAAARMTDVVTLVGPIGWTELLTEASSAILTVDKYGGQATILTGEIGRIFGSRVFISFGIGEREDAVAATGMNDSTGNTFKTAVVVNTTRWKIGDRRDVRFETDKTITTGITQMIATGRWAFMPMETSAAHTCAIINIT